MPLIDRSLSSERSSLAELFFVLILWQGSNTARRAHRVSDPFICQSPQPSDDDRPREIHRIARMAVQYTNDCRLHGTIQILLPGQVPRVQFTVSARADGPGEGLFHKTACHGCLATPFGGSVVLYGWNISAGTSAAGTKLKWPMLACYSEAVRSPKEGIASQDFLIFADCRRASLNPATYALGGYREDLSEIVQRCNDGLRGGQAALEYAEARDWRRLSLAEIEWNNAKIGDMRRRSSDA